VATHPARWKIGFALRSDQFYDFLDFLEPPYADASSKARHSSSCTIVRGHRRSNHPIDSRGVFRP
jgi:hypothetical protein